MSEDDIDFRVDIDKKIDNLVNHKQPEMRKSADDRIRIANEIKNNPPVPGYMKVDVPPGVYSIDLNTDAHWWFNHACTVFPFLFDQGIRTHVDIKDSFKPEKRMPDFNFMWILILIIGIAVMVAVAKLIFHLF
jgi:hypothetical protein